MSLVICPPAGPADRILSHEPRLIGMLPGGHLPQAAARTRETLFPEGPPASRPGSVRFARGDDGPRHGDDMIYRNQLVHDELILGDIPILPLDHSERGLLSHCSADFYSARLDRVRTDEIERFFYDTLDGIDREDLDDLADVA